MNRNAEDNGIRESLCVDVQGGRLSVASCDVIEDDGDTVMHIDVGTIHARLCNGYTDRLLGGFRVLYDRSELSVFKRFGIDPRTVECDLLKGMYNRIAFDQLLAGDIVHAILARIPVYRRVSVSGSVCGLQRRLLRDKLRARQSGSAVRIWQAYRRAHCLVAAYAALPVAAAATLLAVVLSVARGEKTGLKNGHVTGLYLVHADMGNRVRHLIPWIRAGRDKEQVICLLGSGLRGIAREGLPGDALPLRPWRRCKVLTSILRVVRAWPLYVRYVQRMLVQLNHLTPVFALLTHSAMCLIRGQLHREWVRANLKSCVPGRIVLGWSGWADVTEFDLALQHAGHTTVHYLHGLVGDPVGYWGVSSKCVCKTRADVEWLNALDIGHYGRIVGGGNCKSARVDIPAISEKRGGILILTNLVHPANYRYHGIAGDRELQLLEIVSESNTMNRQVTWRPHPCEQDNRREFARLAERADELNYRVDPCSSLQVQLQEASIVITVFSSVLSDVVMSGKVPYVYSGVPYEDTPGWRGISSDLKFVNNRELSALLAPGRYEELCEKHHSRLYELFCYARAGEG